MFAMRKKLIAVLLVLALAVLFAACKNNNEPSLPSFTFDPNTTTTGSDDVSLDPTSGGVALTDPTANDSTVILTTQAGETMQTVATTAFVATPVSTTESTVGSTDPNVSLTVPGMTAPTVVTSQYPGGVTYVTVSSTLPSSPYYTTRPGYTTMPTVNPYLTTQPTNVTTLPTAAPVTVPTSRPTSATTTTAAPTSSATRTSKTAVINDIASTGDKKLVVTIDSKGWDGSFQNNSGTISVKVDGEAKSAPCSVRSSSKNADGYHYITIDLSELSVPTGSNVQFTVPAAFLQTTSGSQYNNAFSGSYTMM